MRLQLVIAALMVGARADASVVHFGLMGLAAADTARLSAFCSEEAAEPCDVEFLFHDTRGRLVKRAAASLQPGFTGFLDIRPSEVEATGGRVGIVPCVFVGRGRVFSSIRVFDVFTQRQRVFGNWADRSQVQGGELHFGVPGMTAFDTARINAICAAASRTDGILPCEVTFIFHVSGGRVLKQATMRLESGAGAFLDLRHSELGLGLRPGEIVPCVRVARGGVVATFEMIDTASGFTMAVAYPAAAAAP